MRKSFPVSEIDLKRNWPVCHAMAWVLAHKPTKEQSKELAERILQSSVVIGSDKFQEKFVKLVNKASKMALGAEVFRRVLSFRQ